MHELIVMLRVLKRCQCSLLACQRLLWGFWWGQRREILAKIGRRLTHACFLLLTIQRSCLQMLFPATYQYSLKERVLLRRQSYRGHASASWGLFTATFALFMNRNPRSSGRIVCCIVKAPRTSLSGASRLHVVTAGPPIRTKMATLLLSGSNGELRMRWMCYISEAEIIRWKLTKTNCIILENIYITWNKLTVFYYNRIIIK